MKIHVDQHRCSGQARCAALAGSVFRLNEEGYNDADDFEVGADQMVEASRGALACPEQAITLLEPAGGELSEDDLRRNAGIGVP